MLEEGVFGAQCFEMVGKQNVEDRPEGDGDRPGIKIEAAPFFKDEPDGGNPGAQQNTCLQRVGDDVNEAFGQSRGAQEQ